MQEVFQSVKEKNKFWLDPRTKLILMIAINLPAFTAKSWVVLALAAAIPISLLFLTNKWTVAFTWAILCTASILSHVFLIDITNHALNIIVIMLSGLICRLMPGLIMGYILFTSTTISEFIAAMERIHVPKQIIIPVSVMFRFFPTIVEESSSINNAMKMRGVGFGKTRGRLITLLEYRLVPLFISCVKIGDELSSCALTRGLGSPVKRTNICEIGFHIPDFIYMIVAVILFSLIIILN